MFQAKNLQVRIGKAIAEQLDGRQRENEVADGAAADDEDPVQLSNV
jgi:hypothetical protein